MYPFVMQAHSDKSRDYTIPEGAHQAAPQPGLPPTSAGWQGNPQAAGPYGPPGVAAQNHGTNGQVPNWNSGNPGYPQPQAPGNQGYPAAPGNSGYPGQMYSAPPQYATSGGFAAPQPPPSHEMHPSQQMLSAHHGNQQRPAGAPATGQPPPYYHH